MKAPGPRTSIQITNPSSATHVLQFTVSLNSDDALRLALAAFLKACAVVVTPTTRDAIARLRLEGELMDQEQWLQHAQELSQASSSPRAAPGS